MTPQARIAAWPGRLPGAHSRFLSGLAFGLLCSLLPQPGHGQSMPSAALFTAAGFASEETLPPSALDGCRGGFVTPSGLAISFGIERIVTLNGNVLAHSALQFGELGHLTAGVPRDGAGMPLQFGRNLLGGSVLQNSLDNQLIGQTTIINASVDARGALQAMHFQSTLSQALTSALTGK